MTAMNIVRMRVKPEHEAEFLERNGSFPPETVDSMRKNGLRRLMVVRTGERSYCFVGEWDSFDSIVNSRPEMISELDRMRGMLEDLGSGLGVTDPVSGEVVIDFSTAKLTSARPRTTVRTSRARRSMKPGARPKKPVPKKAQTAKRAARSPRATGKTRGRTSAKGRGKR